MQFLMATDEENLLDAAASRLSNVGKTGGAIGLSPSEMPVQQDV